MKLSDLEHAAFWDEALCLSCESTIPHEEVERECPICGSTHIADAKEVLSFTTILIQENGNGN